MYAVVKMGGKQYRVAPNDVIKVEKIDAQAGDTIDIDQVMLVSNDEGVKVGKPFVEGARVQATLLEQARGEKLIIFKKKRRKNHRRKKGHRQDLSVLRIVEIAA